MPERRRGDSRPGMAAGVEAGAYATVVALFLWAYVGRFQASAGAIVPHLATLAACLLPFPLLRMLCWRFLPAGGLRRLAVTLLVAVPFLVLLAWYALVLVGLDAWGRVTTWPLIRTYAGQAPHLAAALGVNLWLGATLLLALVLGLLALAWRLAAPRDWARPLAARVSPAALVAMCLAGMLLAPLGLHALLVQHPPHPDEPIALGFVHRHFSGQQHHAIGGSAPLNAREAAARAAYAPAARPPGRNVVVIVGDALRAGHMSALGYHRPTTPRLQQRMAAQDHLLAPYMRSACSESSCGLMALAASRPLQRLPDQPFTLQEALRRNGYQSHFILGGDHTNFYGLRALYGELDGFFDGSQQRQHYINDDQLVLARLEHLPAFTGGPPVMLQFHLMSTHALGSRNPALSRYAPWSNYYTWPGPSPRRPPSQAHAAQGVNFYDNGMQRFDHVADRILTVLEEKGYLRDALVVITGDHGEMLGEQGLFSHSSGLSEAALDIPFILLRHGYSAAPVPPHPWNGQIDIAPTILHELGLPAPDTWQGRPLQLPWQPREIHLQQERNFGLYHLTGTGQVWKFLRNAGTGAESVSDPVADPLGRHDLRDTVPPSLLARWRTQSSSALLHTLEPSEWNDWRTPD